MCTVRALALASVGGGMDGVAPAYDELLCDCHSRCTALYDSPHDDPLPPMWLCLRPPPDAHGTPMRSMLHMSAP